LPPPQYIRERPPGRPEGTGAVPAAAGSAGGPAGAGRPDRQHAGRRDEPQRRQRIAPRSHPGDQQRQCRERDTDLTNQNPGPFGSNDTIQFALGPNPQTITLKNGVLTINKGLAVNGPGAAQLTIDGNHASEVFDIIAGTVSLSGLTIANGKSILGGGIENVANLTVSDCVLSGNITVAGVAASSTPPRAH
jgi:hypothetical protein